ncbi:polysaccharide deacetylase family protein [Paraferrimonas sedimenticola]|uniref:Polysaccharide deacetylase n=1 Tax=Paraferrimonas sedimenticola TaxID=375674 RepID=A0AA37VVZ0_9GAMM|nr:polysaccharide deacetylase family protein [Paraferrimonas sedimenticola]GLP96266.1 polysaccharide deacetylase [Paraferrimonas sedimenticola]
MSINDDYLNYPERSYGMDHERYDWSMLANRSKVEWPQGKKLALWINVPLQVFPLNQQGKPFKVPGGMTMPYPDLRHFSLRDYGNRIGIFRFLEAFDRFGIKASFAFNSVLAERNPYLLDTIVNRGDEILCHGLHMDALHYGGQDKAQESEQVAQALSSLRELSGQAVKGWLSPARNQSTNTPDILAANGIDYCADWVNDDMPYPQHTDNGALWAMPLSNELEDRFIIQNNLHSEDSYVEQVLDAAHMLINEAQASGGRMLTLNIHPWLMGQPHRIGKLEKMLEALMALDVWCAHPSEILAKAKS